MCYKVVCSEWGRGSLTHKRVFPTCGSLPRKLRSGELKPEVSLSYTYGPVFKGTGTGDFESLLVLFQCEGVCMCVWGQYGVSCVSVYGCVCLFELE